MNKRNISMVAILLVMVSVGVFASSNSYQKGMGFARLGQLDAVSGTLPEEAVQTLNQQQAQILQIMQSRQATLQNPMMQGMQGRQASFQGPMMQGMQGRQANFQSPGQGRQVMQNRPRGRR